MTTPAEEPANAAEEDPSTRPGNFGDSGGVGTAQEPPVSALVADEDDLPDQGDDEVQVGMGPTD